MKRRIRSMPIILMVVVLVALSALTVGYSAWSDTLQVNGSVTLAAVPPTPTEAPPSTVSLSGTGYKYWSDQTFISPYWQYDYSSQVGNGGDTVTPAASWSGNVLTVSTRVCITIPINQQTDKSWPLLYHFNSGVGAAVLLNNDGDNVLEISRVSVPSGFNQNFVRPGDSNYAGYGATLSVPKGRSAVISTFREPNWGIPYDGRNLESLPDHTYTETQDSVFKVTNKTTKESATYTIRFTLYVTAVYEGEVAQVGAATALMSMPLTDTLPAADLMLADGQVGAVSSPEVASAQTGYKESKNASFSSPKWLYTYTDRNNQTVESSSAPVAYWSGGVLTIYDNAFIPIPEGTPNGAQTLSSFVSTVGGAIDIENPTSTDLTVTIGSVSGDFSASLVRGSDRSYARSGSMVLSPGDSITASAYCDGSWAVASSGLNLEALSGMSHSEHKSITFRVSNQSTGESWEYTIQFSLTLTATGSATATATPTVAPTIAPTAAPTITPAIVPSTTHAPTATVSPTPTQTPAPTMTSTPTTAAVKSAALKADAVAVSATEAPTVPLEPKDATASAVENDLA